METHDLVITEKERQLLLHLCADNLSEIDENDDKYLLTHSLINKLLT